MNEQIKPPENGKAVEVYAPAQLIPVSSKDPIDALIERAARDPSIDLVRMERLLEMRNTERAERRQQAFKTAMAATQKEMRRIGADKSNSQTHSQYASYAKIDGKLRPIYTGHGFSLMFNSEPIKEDVITVTCDVSHDAGHSVVFRLDMPIVTAGPQGKAVMTRTHATGSAITYAKRYLINMIFNLAIGESDDDGNGTQGMEIGELTDQQIETIYTMVEESGVDTNKFLTWAKAACIEDVPAGKFKDAVSFLALRKQQKANREASEKSATAAPEKDQDAGAAK